MRWIGVHRHCLLHVHWKGDWHVHGSLRRHGAISKNAVLNFVQQSPKFLLVIVLLHVSIRPDLFPKTADFPANLFDITGYVILPDFCVVAAEVALLDPEVNKRLGLLVELEVVLFEGGHFAERFSGYEG